jgi:hypothetical protein
VGAIALLLVNSAWLTDQSDDRAGYVTCKRIFPGAHWFLLARNQNLLARDQISLARKQNSLALEATDNGTRPRCACPQANSGRAQPDFARAQAATVALGP